MLFNSVEFISIFLPAAVALHFYLARFRVLKTARVPSSNNLREKLSAILSSVNVISARSLSIRRFCDRQLPAVAVRQHAEAEAVSPRDDRQTQQVTADLLDRCITGVDPYTANLDHAHGQDPKRSPATTEPFPLEAHRLLPALRARRMDRPGRPQGDSDIVE
jgi:hypothetical protein